MYLVLEYTQCTSGRVQGICLVLPALCVMKDTELVNLQHAMPSCCLPCLDS